jgi:ketosteroid isomerase-like protein
MVLISYHWRHEQDGTISAPSQSKSIIEQDRTMSEQVDNQDRQAAAITRRAVPAAAGPQSVGPAAAPEPVAQLVARAAEKNSAFMRGDMQRWSELVRIAADFTLMQPFGGPASRGFDPSPARMAEMARYFRNGKTALELVQTCASEDLAVLVMIERQSAEVGGMPEQDWSLRVTEVYRKAGSEWQLVHRHADPLVRPVMLKQAAALARGLPVNE